MGLRVNYSSITRWSFVVATLLHLAARTSAFVPVHRTEPSRGALDRVVQNRGSGVAGDHFAAPSPESYLTMQDAGIASPDDTNSTALKRAEQWSRMNPNPVTAKLAAGSTSEILSELFPAHGRLKFGTAGLRGPMGIGPLRMNDLLVIQTAQGIAKYYAGSTTAVVIGYDHRASELYDISSRKLAMWTALVFRQCMGTVVLLDGFVATPIVPFAQQQLQNAIGIMVTASHNPKEDAGYKIYGPDACQIRSPVDEEIAASIQENLVPWKNYRELMLQLEAKSLPSDVCCGLSDATMTATIVEQYFDALKSRYLLQACASSDKVQNRPRIAYTAMNGVGYAFIKRAFEVFGLEAPESVPEQQCPDPKFAGTPFPNPEEAGALDAAMRYAKGCRIILANDPDADRLAVVERRDDDSWYIFTGDEIGCLLGSELYRRSQNAPNASSKVPVMCASTVSSKFLKAFAKAEGFHFEETAPGFKWIGSTAKRLHGQPVRGFDGKVYEHIFSYEESIGYCCGDVVFDKDGISAAIVMAQLVHDLYAKKITLYRRLQQLYKDYGEFVSLNGYFRVSDMEKIPALLQRLSTVQTVETFKVASVQCVQKSDSKPPTQVVLNFESGCVAQFRASGTEPKFKYYFEMPGKPGVPRRVVAEKLKTMMASVLVKLCAPEKYGLTEP